MEPVFQDPTPLRCWCATCRPVTLDDMRMVLCPACGDKRCPRADDHRNECTGSNACTGSNEPGQFGTATHDAEVWGKIDPAVAFHLIGRHGENWAHTGVLMERWARAWVAANPMAKEEA